MSGSVTPNAIDTVFAELKSRGELALIPAFATAQRIAGPVVVEEYGSTVVVPASWTARPDAYGNLILEKSA